MSLNCVQSSLLCKFGPPEWCSGLRHSIAVLAVALEIMVRVQALSQPAATRSAAMGRRTINPALPELGEGLAGRDILVPSRSSDSCGGPSL